MTSKAVEIGSAACIEEIWGSNIEYAGAKKETVFEFYPFTNMAFMFITAMALDKMGYPIFNPELMKISDPAY